MRRAFSVAAVGVLVLQYNYLSWRQDSPTYVCQHAARVHVSTAICTACVLLLWLKVATPTPLPCVGLCVCVFVLSMLALTPFRIFSFQRRVNQHTASRQNTSFFFLWPHLSSCGITRPVEVFFASRIQPSLSLVDREVKCVYSRKAEENNSRERTEPTTCCLYV